MTPSSLPLDLLDVLCGLLDLDDLLSFSLTNSRLHPFAQRFVYRHISLYSHAKATRCLRTLSTNAQLALFVRSFSLRLDPAQPVFGAFARLLSSALSKMVNVTCLDLVLQKSASAVLNDPQMPVLPHLTQFVSNFPLDAAVSGFLARLPALRDLQTGSDHPDFKYRSLLPQYSPKISSFSGSCSDAAVVVPGRPVECIHLHSGLLSEDVLGALAKSTAPITIFGAFTTSLTPSLLSSLVHNLPHLCHLRIMTVYHSSEAYDENFYEQAARILDELPELLTAELAGVHWTSWKRKEVGFGAASRDKHAEDSNEDVPSEEETSAYSFGEYDEFLY